MIRRGLAIVVTCATIAYLRWISFGTPAEEVGPTAGITRAEPVSADATLARERIRRAKARHGALPEHPPTEHRQTDDAEQRHKQARKDWVEEMHTAGDVDWKAVERANGLAQIRKRNRLALRPPPAEPNAPTWQERGSDNQAGRMHVTRHSRDGASLYGGSALGGIWRRPVAGGPWEPLADNLYGGAHWLELYPQEGGPDVMLAANDSGLVHRSDDDGATWVAPQGTGFQSVRRLLRTADPSATTFLISGLWTGFGWEYTLNRSTNDGASFSSIRALQGFGADVWTPRVADHAEAGVVYLLDDEGLLVSSDFGTTFTPLAPLPEGDWYRGELTGHEVSGRLWAILANVDNQFFAYRTDDRGTTWEQVAQVTDYWGSLNASIVDPDVFAWGGVEVYRTLDGGDSFSIVNRWSRYYRDIERNLHADIPGIDVVLTETGDEIWYFSTDGGLYESRDGTRNVNNLSLDGLRVSQYYDVLTSSVNPAHVAAGSQDQGYQSSQTILDQPDEIYELEQLVSGDYGHLTSSDGSHGVIYSVYPTFMLVSVGEVEPEWLGVDFPITEGPRAFLPPVVADPMDPFAVFYCADRVYRYTWAESEETWVHEPWSVQAFNNNPGEYVSALTFSPINPDRAYLATNLGRLFVSDNRGQNWRASEGELEGHWFYGTALVASGEDPDLAYVGGNGYNGPGVLRTIDGGDTWEAWGEGLPPTLVYSLAEATDGSGKLFAGTETAAYERRRDVGEWVDITGNDAPVTTYWSAEVLTAENTVRFGTYGRGIWDYQRDPEGTGCIEDQDEDRDGAACDIDCADDDPALSPLLEEVCDGVDANCDPNDMIEIDADGDGFLACEECNDADPTAFPGAEEVFGNDIDENCDGVVETRCGCQTNQAGAGLALLMPLLLLLRRRRSRHRMSD